jgi:hypothetical protein
MRYRCEKPSKHNFKHYGARGIKVCARWQSFENFLEDMGERPPGTTLDRKEQNGDYCKENCRWATRLQQANNARSNHMIEVDGKRMSVSEAAREYAIPMQRLWSRLKLGWPPALAVRAPLQAKRRFL